MDSKVKQILKEYIGVTLNYEVFIVWKCKVLQNAKWLLCTNLPDDKYYELTYNGDKNELYIDEYDKKNNCMIKKPFDEAMKDIELKPFDKVLVRDNDNDVWQIDLFEKQDPKMKYVCLMSAWNQCILFENNRHLLGTTDSPQKDGPQEKVEKQDEINDNYGYPKDYFKPNDVVLCRDKEDSIWVIDVFLKRDGINYPFKCHNYNWETCIPYEGNEHLLGTNKAPSPEQSQTKENKKSWKKIENEGIQKLVSEINPNNIKALIAYNRLCTIAQAWNKADGFEPDFSNTSQYKYFPWFEYSRDAAGFVFALTDVTATNAYAHFGSRLCFKTRERAMQFGKKFIDLWNDLLLNNKTNMENYGYTEDEPKCKSESKEESPRLENE